MSRTSEFEALKESFGRPALVFGPSKVRGRWTHVGARLEAFGLEPGVDFDYSPNVVYTSSLGHFKHVTVVGSEGYAVEPSPYGNERSGVASVAKHAALMARHYGYCRDFTVALALIRRSKTLPHVAPVSIHDINGGVTFINEQLVVVWRDDPDFWKVLTHELVHLFTQDVDEARVEATALRMWCALESTNETEYSTMLKRQIAKTARNAERVARTAAGKTPIVDYTYGALCWLTGGNETRCAKRPFAQAPSGEATETFVSTVKPAHHT